MTRARSGLSAGADCDNEISSGTAADVFDAVDLIGSGEAYAAGSDGLTAAIDRQFDSAFAHQPQLAMQVVVRRVRHFPGRQRGLVDLQHFSCRQFALQYGTHFRAVGRSLYG